MVRDAQPFPDDKGYSAWRLTLVFLAGVAVCGVFFSLGFLVGYNERSGRAAPVTERVPTSGPIPPTLNPPLENTPIEPGGAVPSSASSSPPLARAQTDGAAPQSSADKPMAAPGPGASPPEVPLTRSMAEKEPAPGGATASPDGSEESAVGFIVQVAASRTKQDAESLVRILKRRGYQAFLVKPGYAHSSDNLSRVQVGPFTSKQNAEAVRLKLKHQGFKPFIVKR